MKKINEPLLSIITVTYNLIKNGRKDFIIKNIESVHFQTYSNVEHIIIDGASDDGTLGLLRPYEEKGWIKIYSEKDNGIYDAMNKGLKFATGDYISFLNSDDFYHNAHGFEHVIEKIKNTGYDFLYSSCNYVKKDGTCIGILRPVSWTFFVRMPFCHQTLFVKTHLMRELGGFDAINFKSAGDYDFVVRLFLSGAEGGDYCFNFVSFRIGGFSNLDSALSNNESVKLFHKNYDEMIDGMPYDLSKMFFEFLVPEVLYEKIVSVVHKQVQQVMREYWNSLPYVKEKIKYINVYSCVEELKISWIIHLPIRILRKIKRIIKAVLRKGLYLLCLMRRCVK